MSDFFPSFSNCLVKIKYVKPLGENMFYKDEYEKSLVFEVVPIGMFPCPKTTTSTTTTTTTTVTTTTCSSSTLLFVYNLLSLSVLNVLIYFCH